MVKENLIPKTETIQEINNQIPTYEEFLRNYGYDNNLNYDDLNDYVSEKGYGPCEKYCGWNNPKCNCYVRVEEGFMPLNSSCPACGTINSDGSSSFSKPNQWVHSDCGGQSYISRKVRLKCFRCGTEGYWREWSFKCGRHAHFKPVSETSSRIFINALSIAAGNLMNADDNETRDIIADIGTKLWNEFRSGR